MRLKLLLLSALYLLIYSLIYKEFLLERKIVNKPAPVEKKNQEFELTLGKILTDDSSIVGEDELVKSIQKAKEISSKKQTLDEVYSEFIHGQSLSARNGSTLLKVKARKDSVTEFVDKFALEDGLEYRLNKNWSLGVQVDNPLGWFQSDEEGLPFLGSEGNDAKSSVLFTVKYSF